MRSLLVTGGAGFIGSNFVRYTRAHYPDAHIVVLDALTYAGSLTNLEGVDGIEFIHASINDEAVVDEAVHRVDAIVHFAAESHNDRAIVQPDIFFETNVMGTLMLLKAATRYNVRFHHISTDEVYGDTPLESLDMFTEDSPYKPSSPYAASKAASDHMVRAWARTYGLQATISNCSNNLGPYQHIEKFIPRAITNVLSGLPIKVYGDGLAIRDWIHVEDQCSAIWAILQRGRIGETYLVGAQCALSNLSVVKRLAEILGGSYEVRVEHVRNRVGADRRYALDSSKIRSELGWQPQRTDFNANLSELVEWYSSHESWWKDEKEGVEAGYALEGH